MRNTIYWVIISVVLIFSAKILFDQVSVSERIIYVPKIQYVTKIEKVYIQPTNQVRDAYVTKKIEEVATMDGVDPIKALKIAYDESRYIPDALGDMTITCKRTDLPVHSRGLWQISTCYFPDITDAQAYDVDWSTNWAMSQLKKGEATCKLIWSTCK